MNESPSDQLTLWEGYVSMLRFVEAYYLAERERYPRREPGEPDRRHEELRAFYVFFDACNPRGFADASVDPERWDQWLAAVRTTREIGPAGVGEPPLPHQEVGE